MGSSPWERPNKLLASALDLVAQKSRTEQEWSDHLQPYVGLDHLVMVSDPCERSARLLAFAVTRAVQENQPEFWADHLQRFVFDPRSGKFVRFNYADKRWESINRPSYAYVDPAMRVEHLPIRGQGTADVSIDLLPDFPYEPTTQQILDTMEASGRRCDRAEGETYLDNLDDSIKADLDKRPVVVFCGPLVQVYGFWCVPCVVAHAHGRRLLFRHVGRLWSRRCRFAFARSI